MQNNFKPTVINAIAETQDGKSIAKADRFNDFINECIDWNTYKGGDAVNVDDLISDFNYMIDQLKRASKPLQTFVDKLATR